MRIRLYDEYEIMTHPVRVYKRGFLDWVWCAGVEGKLGEGRAWSRSKANQDAQVYVCDYELMMKEERERNSRAARSRLQ